MPCDRIPWIQPISSRNAPGVWSVSKRIKRSTAWAPRHPFPQCPKLAFCWHTAKLTSKFHIYMYIYIYLFNCMGFPVIITSFWKTTIPILGCIPTSCNTNKALHKDFMKIARSLRKGTPTTVVSQTRQTMACCCTTLCTNNYAEWELWACNACHVYLLCNAI